MDAPTLMKVQGKHSPHGEKGQKYLPEAVEAAFPER